MKVSKRRSFLGKFSFLLFSFFVGKVKPLFAKRNPLVLPKNKGKLYFPNGFKVTEVSATEAIVWTRLSHSEKSQPITHKKTKTKPKANNYYPVDFDENQPVKNMDGAIIGAKGKVRIKYKAMGETLISDWYETDSIDDFTAQIPLSKLKAGERYSIELEAMSEDGSDKSTVPGSFMAAYDAKEVKSVNLTTSTCQYFWNYDDAKRGFQTYDAMAKLKPDFFVHTGDYVYYDRIGPLATDLEKARHKWHAMDGWPSLKDFYQNVPIYMLKDDHDLLKDDVYPDSSPLGDFTLENGLKVWRENVPLKDKPYRTFRWGKDLQIWLVEGREYRSPKEIPEGSPRTIWGEEQKNWFIDTIESSDATFKILFSPTPVVGPDRDNKRDNHANKLFEKEGNWLRGFLSGKKSVFVVNGDRHWQYFSIDEATGLREFGAGPVSDAQSGGWSQDDKRPEHRFLRVKGGFLGIKVFREAGKPKIDFTHYDVKGNVMNQEEFEN
ncbi:alkaline phosphatase D family protein [Cyclobacterium sp. 1_MG-2023]|uniref:alkaline phosphatase D family protein n=1 Tax=Cyclobacterium sp. 1_MG-2023 TaxID=3062681 RepID=UPI0026E32CD6|nr:alkaline phosphatase D family protein [Cyclobacterium sp. 1_MG-2023]MDO6436928.1 alkaline phosphatase D family protein [Cyclobacterium sp. 1_MG-2023]